MPCILKNLMWSTMIKLNIHVFIFENCIFSFVVTLKNWQLRISCFRNEGESVRINYCSSQKNDGVLHIIDQIKISGRVPVWIFFKWMVTRNSVPCNFVQWDMSWNLKPKSSFMVSQRFYRDKIYLGKYRTHSSDD